MTLQRCNAKVVSDKLISIAEIRTSKCIVLSVVCMLQDSNDLVVLVLVCS